MPPNEASLTGGCQCGKVRFRAGRLGRSTICHCRMCQKAFGSFFAPLVTAYEVRWTRGQPGWFQSSDQARRGFCAACGTPLAYQVLEDDGGEIELAVGAFDDPNVAAPMLQVNPRDKLAFFDRLSALPTRPPGQSAEQEAFNARVVNRQHPDHDTENWPPAQGARQ